MERGISAAGSAQHWQCWGQGFESPMLHQATKTGTHVVWVPVFYTDCCVLSRSDFLFCRVYRL